MLLRTMLISLFLLGGISGAVAAEAKAPPEGLICPDEAGGAVLLNVGGPSGEPGVLGYCIYYRDDDEANRNVTVTLSLADGAIYDYARSFKAPKLSNDDATVLEEGTRTVPFGAGEAEAAMIATRNLEPDPDVSETFDTLWVVKRPDGKVVTLEEEYSNLTLDMIPPLREALLKAQPG